MVEPILELSSPLRELVLAQVEASAPPYRGALVLCAGYNRAGSSESARTSLAAALEMLAVSLAIHEQLLASPSHTNRSNPAAEERTYIGANILAGDFCFSCSARLAARTDSPAVVAIFATALQIISELRLRQLMPDGDSREPNAATTDEVIMRSGIAAALELSDLEMDERAVISEAAGSIVDYVMRIPSADRPLIEELATLPEAHVRRWLSFREWLDALHPHSDTAR